MFLKNRPSLSMIAERARVSFYRFPFVLLVSFLLGAISIWMIEMKSVEDEKILFALALGIPFFTTTTLLRENRNWTSFTAKAVEFCVGAGFLVLYYAIAKGDDTNNFFLKYLQISLILHLAVSFVGFFGRSGTAAFWQFNRHIFLRFLLSALYASVFFVGLAIALSTTTVLFTWKFDAKIYGELAVIAVCFVQTWHFLAGVPRLADLSDETSEFPSGLRVFVQFLLIPMVSLYMVILYVYMAKILLTQNWPSGYIGWLVSAMSVLGVFNLLLIDPEKVRTPWIRAYSKSFYVLILPLLVMLFAAITKRFSAYGVTEPRYFLSALGLWLAGIAVYFVVSRSKSIKVIPISLCLLSLITMVGPWSAYSVSLRSQLSQAEALMTRVGALENGHVKRVTTKVSEADEKKLSSILDYLVRSQSDAQLVGWFPEGLKTKDADLAVRNRNAVALMEQLGMTYVSSWGSRERANFSVHAVAESAFETNGFPRAATFEVSSYGSSNSTARRFGDRRLTVVLKTFEPMLLVKFDNGKEVEVPLSDQIESVHKAHSLVEKRAVDVVDVPLGELTIDLRFEGAAVRLILREIMGEVEADGLRVNSVAGWILVR